MGDGTSVGGLNYRITVKDNFSAATEKFRKELIASRQEFRQFVVDMKAMYDLMGAKTDAQRKKVIKNIEKQQVAEEENVRNQGLLLKEDVENWRKWARARGALETKAAARTRQNMAQEKADLSSLMKKRAAEYAKWKAEHQAYSEDEKRAFNKIKRAIDAINKVHAEAIREHRRRAAAADRYLRDESRAWRMYHRTIDQAAAALQRAHRAAIAEDARRTRSAGLMEVAAYREDARRTKARAKGQKSDLDAMNRISFTFRRLIGIFAVFQAVRMGVTYFRQMVESAIALNAQIESATIGYAAILASSSKIVDNTGKAVDAQTAFSASIAISRDQINKLRVDSMRTNATFEDLLVTMQSAAAPGRKAGMSPDQIRRVTVRIAQLAGSIGIRKDQFEEEVRSLIGGTATGRTTRSVGPLGGAERWNREMKEATKAGKAFEFIMEKTTAYALAGEMALDTFTGALTNAKDALALVAGDSSLKFFEKLKALFKDVQALMRGVSPEGAFIINPKALAASSMIFDELAASVELIRGALKDPMLFENTAGSMAAIGASLRTLADVVIGLVQGIQAGLTRIVSIFRVVSNLLGKIVNDSFSFDGAVQGAAKAAGFLLTIVTTISTLSWAIRGAWLAIRAIWITMGKLPGPAKWALLLVASLEAAIRLVTDGENGLAFLVGSVFFKLEQQILLTFARIESAWVSLQSSLTLISLKEEANRKAQLAGDIDEINLAYALNITELKRDPRSEQGILDLLNEQVDAIVARMSKEESPISGILGMSDQERFYGEELVNIHESLADNVELAEKLKESFKTAAENLKDARAGAEGLAASMRSISRKSRESLDKTLEPLLEKQDTALRIAFSGSRALGGTPGAYHKGAILHAFDVVGILRAEMKKLAADYKKIEMLERQAQLVKYAQGAPGTIDALSISNRIAEVEGGPMGAAEKSLKLAKLQVQQEMLVTAEKQKQLAAMIAEFKLQRESEDPKSRLETEQAIAFAMDEQAANAEELRLKIAQIKRKAEEGLGGNLMQPGLTPEQQIARIQNFLSALETGSWGLVEGIKEAFFQLGAALPSSFAIALDTMKSAVKEFASLISDLIVDAFDPTTDTNIMERFARFLQGIAKMVIATLVEMAVAKAVLGLGSILGSSAASGAGAAIPAGAISNSTFVNAAHAGGFINRRGGVDPYFGRRAGYDRGGSVTGRPRHPFYRPSGLHPSDRIPIWTAAGEVVTQEPAVRKYGLRLFDALNSMKLPAEPLRALAANVTAAAVRQPSVPNKVGFAGGGQVQQYMQAPGGGGGGPTPAYIVANEQAAERLMAGGRNAQMLFFRNNRDAVKQALGLRR